MSSPSMATSESELVTKSNCMERNATKQKRNWWLLPLELILFLLPLIVRFQSGNSGYTIYPWNSKEDSYIDIFLHYKMVVFIGIAFVVLVDIAIIIIIPNIKLIHFLFFISYLHY